jgi:hypothetical protein
LPLQSNSGHHPTPRAPNSKNDDVYQFARARSTWKPNFAQIGGFLYFGGHFGFKMATIMETKKGGFKKNWDSFHQTS